MPITGHVLSGIENRYLIKLIFQATNGIVSELQFEHEVILTLPASSATIIMATKPGATFDQVAACESLSPLIGERVAEALAHANGDLELTFYNGSVLEVYPDNYEAWHFQQPAAATKPHYPTPRVSVTGYAGGLL